ncbi:hypothetical protein AB0E63_05570 [Kribbella sp. NPDC026596]|uniref:hypothetical protein n=1 Tax=Kribbella sp. NPDC026596 TaxID=3155122 RepID=UPI0033BFD02D
MTVRPPTCPLPAPVPPLPQTATGIVAPYDFALQRKLWRRVPADVSLHATRTPYAPLAARGHELSEPIVVTGDGIERLTDLPHELTIRR